MVDNDKENSNDKYVQGLQKPVKVDYEEAIAVCKQ